MFDVVRGYNLTGADEPVRVNGLAVTANLFQTLGVNPAIGRGFSIEEETQGRDRVAILNCGLWQRRFGSDKNILGRTISIDGNSYTIVGVMPAGFSYPGGGGEILGGILFNPTPDFWVPLALSPEMRQLRGRHEWQVVGRLKQGVSFEHARTEMDALQARMEKANPGNFMGTGCTLIPLREQSTGNVKTTLLVLLGAVAFILLIGCTNVANLLLARAAARQKEIAIRAALGAGRWALMRQLLTESALLALCGGALGSVLAWWGVGLLVTKVSDKIAQTTPGWNEIGLDLRVLLFTLIISLLTGLLFGLVPALQTTNYDLNATLKEGGRGSTEGARRNRFRSFLVISEVGLATVLLVGVGLLLQSLLRLQNVNPGFNPQHVLTMELGLPEMRFTDEKQRNAFVERLRDRLKAVPGVQFVGATSALPLSGAVGNFSFEVEGEPPLAPGKFQTADVTSVTPDYFTAMQIPLRAGRLFETRDREAAPRVAIINRALADRYFSNTDPVGKKLKFFGDEPWTIVGVAQDLKNRVLDSSLQPAVSRALFESGIFIPYAQGHFGNTVGFAIRSRIDPMILSGSIRAVVREIDPQQAIAKLRPMKAVVSSSIAQPRFRTLLLAMFGALAVVLAAIGLYGVLAYIVSQRTHEIGIRVALGAQMREVFSRIVRQGMTLAVAGVALGLLASLALTRVLSSMLFQVKPTDPITFGSVALLLIVVAFLACWIPARRAMKVDPMEALRYE
jgi:putative ABC transport system permease protein